VAKPAKIDEAPARIEPAPLVVRLRPVIELPEERFFELAGLNQDLRMELTAQGELIVMPPAGGETSNRNAELTMQLRLMQLRLWAKRDGHELGQRDLGDLDVGVWTAGDHLLLPPRVIFGLCASRLAHTASGAASLLSPPRRDGSFGELDHLEHVAPHAAHAPLGSPVLAMDDHPSVTRPSAR
jgi:putative restriction endonuclease